MYVYLDASPDDVHREGGRAPDVIDELRDRVRYLEHQVEEERDARRRADTLLARLMDRVPELEPASEVGKPADHLEHEEALREGADMETRTDEQRQRGMRIDTERREDRQRRSSRNRIEVSPGPIPQARKEAHSVRGGVGCSEANR